MASFNPSAGSNNGSPLAGMADQARLWWDGSPNTTRVISVGLAVLVVLCLAAAILLASTPEYQDLFTSLDPHDAAAIAQKLDDAHVKYQMTDNETTIRVPAADKDRLRMEMIRDGLPSKTGSVVGSDWLDKIGMGTTSDVQGQYIRMAQEGELAQTISSMNEISSAAVHISPGSDSPFAGENSPPTSSVVIGLKPGVTLTSDQTMGIANLVSKAVPGLDIKNVAVVDTNGNQLWDGGEQAGPGGLASNRMVAERQFSDDLRKQMQSYLDTVLGARKALVSVHAELNYNQVHSQATQFAKGAVLSTQETDEKYKGSSGPSNPTPAGVAGNSGQSGAPQYAGSSQGSSKSGDYENQADTTNYNNDKVETDTQQAPGGIQRLAVAVLIDQSVPTATVDSIRSYLSTLAGASQGDLSRVVTVQSVPFSNTDAQNQQAMMRTAQNQERTQELIKVGAVAAVAIVLLLIFLRSTRTASVRVAAGAQQIEGGASAASSTLPYLEGVNTDGLLDEPMSIEDVLDGLPMPSPRPKRKPMIPEIEEQLDVKLESVREMVKNHPQSVALLMKGWMADEIDASSL